VILAGSGSIELHIPARTPPSAAQTPTGQNHCAEVLVVLSTNQLSLLVEHARKITAAIDASTAGALTFVDVG
jgi:hypothetical protein